ncbi:MULTISPECIES: chorismate mutase [Micromonospora]|uniref:chorismate mutase n=1 Tax=Micromonospora TaxID=1873 RepID=UPI001AE59917|nr:MULTISPECIES: chorismate mutase [unclassified Micromonospora]MBP1780665.1 chorismate mutase [Micromonospora sp. HB375]
MSVIQDSDVSHDLNLAELAPTGIGGGDEPVAFSIPQARVCIDAIDHQLILLLRERAELARQLGDQRVALGMSRVALAGEYEVVRRFRAALGPDGAQLAALLLRPSRQGPLRWQEAGRAQDQAASTPAGPPRKESNEG